MGRREGEHMGSRPVRAMPDAMVRGMPLRMSENVAGRDRRSNWWAGRVLTAEMWMIVEAAVRTCNERAAAQWV
jgi:hypothetical protein